MSYREERGGGVETIRFLFSLVPPITHSTAQYEHTRDVVDVMNEYCLQYYTIRCRRSKVPLRAL